MEDGSFDAQITFLYVTDLGRSAAFYGDALGLELVRDQGVCLIYRVAGDAHLGLCDHRPADPGGLIITLVADDVDGWADHLRGLGHVVDGPKDNDRFALRHCFLTDPDGHLVEIQRFREAL